MLVQKLSFYTKQKRGFYSESLYTSKRIGPHNKDVISVLVGNLLGDGRGEKRGKSSRFQIHISSRKMEYVSWVHGFFAERGYCSLEKPVVRKTIGRFNQIYYSVHFNLFSFKSLNYLYDLFYFDRKKVVPANIESLLTEQALAVWIMSNGGKSADRLKISSKRLSQTESLFIQKAFSRRFSLEPIIKRDKGNFLLHFKEQDILTLFEIVKPHLLSCMYYKLVKVSS